MCSSVLKVVNISIFLVIINSVIIVESYYKDDFTQYREKIMPRLFNTKTNARQLFYQDIPHNPHTLANSYRPPTWVLYILPILGDILPTILGEILPFLDFYRKIKISSKNIHPKQSASGQNYQFQYSVSVGNGVGSGYSRGGGSFSQKEERTPKKVT